MIPLQSGLGRLDGTVVAIINGENCKTVRNG